MIFFRTDCNIHIASGHVMRCLSLAQAFQKQHQDITFLVSDEQSVEMIKSRGFPVVILHTFWQDLSVEMELVQQLIYTRNCTMLIIDTYAVSRRYVEALGAMTKVCYLGSKLEFLGDIYALINYSTDIDYDFYRRNYNNMYTRLLLGPMYAPLRQEFQGKTIVLKNQVVNILLTVGNTDNMHLVNKIIKCFLKDEFFKNIKLDVVIGQMFIGKSEILAQYETHSRVTLYQNITSMSALMGQADLAISANGTTVYELAAMGIPTVTFAIGQEQVASAKKLDFLGVISYAGEAFLGEECCIKNIIILVKKYCDDSFARKEMAIQAHHLIDGNGCNRIVKALLDSKWRK